MSLSFLRACADAILRHSPAPPPGCPPIRPLDNPCSLIRTLERLLLEYDDNDASAPRCGECARWACGLVRNLATSEENAALLAMTDIPRCVLGNVRNASSPPAAWTSNCLE
jgi:hypothetical protein